MRLCVRSCESGRDRRRWGRGQRDDVVLYAHRRIASHLEITDFEEHPQHCSLCVHCKRRSDCYSIEVSPCAVRIAPNPVITSHCVRVIEISAFPIRLDKYQSHLSSSSFSLWPPVPLASMSLNQHILRAWAVLEERELARALYARRVSGDGNAHEQVYYSTQIARERHNRDANRYSNVLPYDRAVVGAGDGQEYINASVVVAAGTWWVAAQVSWQCGLAVVRCYDGHAPSPSLSVSLWVSLIADIRRRCPTTLQPSSAPFSIAGPAPRHYWPTSRRRGRTMPFSFSSRGGRSAGSPRPTHTCRELLPPLGALP